MFDEKLKTAVMRRSDVATRGLDMAVLMCVSTVLRAVRPTLSMVYSIYGDMSGSLISTLLSIHLV
jgi:hypothetical protein